MKIILRVMLVAAMLGASLLGGYLASWIAPEKAQAASMTAAFGPPVKLSLLNIPNASTEPDTFGTTAVKIADIGTFTVENPSSLVEITHQGRLMVDSFSSTNSVYFELRVDGVTGIQGGAGQPSGMGLVRYEDAGQYVISVFSGYWQNLTAGSHTVSMWVRTHSGTATNALIDPGGWGTNIVIVKEYLPFGSTYLPAITR